MSSPEQHTSTSIMPENEKNELFDPLAYIDNLVTQPERLRDRIHKNEGGEGMLAATAIACRYERMARRGVDPNVVVDNYVTTAVQILSGKVASPEAIEVGTAMILQLWDGYFSQQDKHSLLSAAVQQRIADLPSQAQRYGLTQEQAQKVSQNFQTLTTAP